MNNNKAFIFNYGHNGCLLHLMANALTELGDEKCGKKLLSAGKKYFGIASLSGMPEEDQIKKMNRFMRDTLEPLPNTTAIRAWLENGNNMNEYLYLFKTNWATAIIQLGVFR